MAVKKEDEASKQSGALVAQTGSTELSAEMMAEIEADAGAGTSQSADDNIVPFIVLLQDMSPEVKKREADYVQGAEPGMLLNKATRQLYASDEKQAAETGFPLLRFQPCAFDRSVNEWIPRIDGGGFVAKHDLVGSVEQTMARVGARQVEVADERGEKRTVWRDATGKHDMVDTRYHYGHAVGDDGSLSPAVLGFASTGHTASREWMTLMNNHKINAGGRLVVEPSWFRVYNVRSKPKSNKKGDFFVITVDDGPRIEDAASRAAGKALHAAFSAGTIRADDAAGEGATSGSASRDTDVPI